MFTEFLKTHPMADLLQGQMRTIYPPAEDRSAWEGIPETMKREIRDRLRGTVFHRLYRRMKG